MVSRDPHNKLVYPYNMKGFGEFKQILGVQLHAAAALGLFWVPVSLRLSRPPLNAEPRCSLFTLLGMRELEQCKGASISKAALSNVRTAWRVALSWGCAAATRVT